MLEFIRLNLKAFISDEKAISSLEYAILAVVILGAIVAIFAVDESPLKGLFNRMSSVITKAGTISTPS